MKVVTPEQMRGLDRRAIEEAGIPGEKLMEKAGEGVAEKVKELLTAGRGESTSLTPPPTPLPTAHSPLPIILIAGKGNNGGDALVAARLLHADGVECRTFLLGRASELKGDAALNLDRLKETAAPWEEVEEGGDLEGLRAAIETSSVVVDGIFGTGFRGSVEGTVAEVIILINQAPGRVISIDIPSGVDGESGAVEGDAVTADWTVTMALPKTGLLRGEGLNRSGELEPVDIGIPAQLVDEIPADLELITEEELSDLLPPRPLTSHKGDYGHVLVLAGSPGFTGAAALATEAALRAGAGLVTLGIPQSLNPILESKCTEAMTLPLPETGEGTLSPGALEEIVNFCRKASVVALGPGLSRNGETGELVRELIRNCPLPMVVDADGLNLIAEDVSVLSMAQSSLVLTPHPGEMRRLAGLEKEELGWDREKLAQDFARKYNLTLVLKGAGTLIATPPGPLWINPTGNPGMASGGTGDVLTGLIAGFLAQGLPPFNAARLGVYVHGRAGDLAAREKGRISLIASDLIARVPDALRGLFPWNR